jgi:hypothetical protein
LLFLPDPVLQPFSCVAGPEMKKQERAASAAARKMEELKMDAQDARDESVYANLLGNLKQKREEVAGKHRAMAHLRYGWEVGVMPFSAMVLLGSNLITLPDFLSTPKICDGVLVVEHHKPHTHTHTPRRSVH